MQQKRGSSSRAEPTLPKEQEEAEAEEEEEEEEEMEEEEMEEEELNGVEMRIVNNPWKFLLITSESQTILSVNMANESGEVVAEHEVHKLVASINLQNVNAGKYIVTINTDGGKMTEELTID